MAPSASTKKTKPAVRNTFIEVLPTPVLRARAVEERARNAKNMTRAELVKYHTKYSPLEREVPGELMYKIHMRHKKVALNHGKNLNSYGKTVAKK
jgi:hypothetical protein